MHDSGCPALFRPGKVSRDIPATGTVTKHYEITRAYILKDSKGSINWYRYQELILKPKLILFTKECLKERPRTII